MGLTMEQQKAVASQMATRYRQASKKHKGQIIEQYMGLSGCTRHHAAWLLRCWGTTVWDRHDGQPVKIVVGQRRRRRIVLTPQIREKLMRISPATIDRLPEAEKRKLMPRRRSHTKPTGTLLLQIPIRTFSEWQNVAIGTLGLDMVGHDGGSAAGEYTPGAMLDRPFSA